MFKEEFIKLLKNKGINLSEKQLGSLINILNYWLNGMRK